MEHTLRLENMPTIAEVVYQAWKQPFSTKGDFARGQANAVAAAAQEGLITTRMAGDLYGGEWRPTTTGLDALDKLEKS